MPSILDNSLVDRLVPIADLLRATLSPIMGNRAYAVHLVRRRWSGARRGQGSPSIVSDVTLTPPPQVTFANNEQSLHFEAAATGRQEEGDLTLTEVSLRYTEADLSGDPVAVTDEFYYKLVDAHGQQMQARYYVPSAPPRPDREKDIGWIVELRRVELME